MQDAIGPRSLGVTVVGEFVVSEGVDRILDNLQRAGVGAVATTPAVATPAAAGEGRHEPPDAADLHARLLGGLTREDLDAAGRAQTPLEAAERLAGGRLPTDWWCLKAALSRDLIASWRAAMSESDPSRRLVAHAFMPPFSAATGFDFPRAGGHCDAVAPKLYTMHWSRMVRLWGEPILAGRPGLGEARVVKALVNLMDLARPQAPGETFAAYGYPRPHEDHFVSEPAQRRKIRQTVAAGPTPVCPVVHGYGPKRDCLRRFRVAVDSGCPEIWITRYGYLGDEKLEAVAKIWREARRPGDAAGPQGAND